MKTIEEYLEHLDWCEETNCDAPSSIDFHHAIKYALELDIIDPSFLALNIGMSLSSVSRWRNGRNAPHPTIRANIYKLLRKKAKELINNGK